MIAAQQKVTMSRDSKRDKSRLLLDLSEQRATTKKCNESAQNRINLSGEGQMRSLRTSMNSGNKESIKNLQCNVVSRTYKIKTEKSLGS